MFSKRTTKAALLQDKADSLVAEARDLVVEAQRLLDDEADANFQAADDLRETARKATEAANARDLAAHALVNQAGNLEGRIDALAALTDQA